MVSINLTTFIILGILIVLNFILNRILYTPVMGNLKKRRDYLTGLNDKINSNMKIANTLEDILVKELNRARIEVNYSSEHLVIEAEKHAEHLLELRQAEYEKALRNHQEMINQLKIDVQKDIRPNAEKLTELFRKKILPFVAIFFLSALMFGSTGIHASSEEIENNEHHSESHHGTSVKGDLEKAFNFLIMVSLLVFLFRKPVIKALHGRTQGIKRKISKTLNEVTRSQTAIHTAQKKQQLVRNEIQEMETMGRQKVKYLEDRIMEKANHHVKLLDLHEKLSKQQQLKWYRQEIQKQIVSETIQLVSEDFKNTIDAQTDRRIVQENLALLDKHILKVNGSS